MNGMPSQPLAQLVETRVSTFTAFEMHKVQENILLHRSQHGFRESRIYERNTGFAHLSLKP